MSDGSPVVTVVVIVYDDERHLADAVRSALAQSLTEIEVVVVDDASTDGTPGVLAGLAAEDGRVRPVRLPSNSGGCSLPRNTGLAEARGRYVTFLDSDDTLEPDACAVLVAAAESTGAEVVCGLVRRFFADGRVEEWKPDLHASVRVTTARRTPRVLHDTIAPGKLYRRDFLRTQGIEFPLGVLFEDYRFSACVYAEAAAVALVPDPVYRWTVSAAQERASITQRFDDVTSFADRLRGHRLAVEALTERGHGDLVAELDRKFLTHDLRLYTRHLRSRDAAYRSTFLELADGYLDTVSPEVLEGLGVTDTLAVIGLRSGATGLVTLAARVHYRGSPPLPRSTEPLRARPAPLRRLRAWGSAAVAVTRLTTRRRA